VPARVVTDAINCIWPLTSSLEDGALSVRAPFWATDGIAARSRRTAIS